MKRSLIALLFAVLPTFMMAQTQQTTMKDKYCHTTGTATTRTLSNGKVETIYKDKYGHTTGTSTTRTK